MDDSSFDTQLKTTDRFKELVASVSDRQAVAKVFGKDSKIPLKGRQLIVDRFETGNIYTELSRAVSPEYSYEINWNNFLNKNS